MSASLEDRLRRALAQRAETTTTSPDGWRRNQAGVEPARRPALRRWSVLGPAAALAVIVLVVAIVVGGGERDRTVRVTGDGALLRLVPDGTGTRFHLLDSMPRLPGDPPPPWTYRAFGRRAADGVAVKASVVITMPGDRARAGATPEPAPLRVLGQDLFVANDPFGQRIVRWTQPDGRDVGLMAFGLSQAELVTVVESLLAGDAAKDLPMLPPGFRPLGSGSSPGAVPVRSDTWRGSDGATLTISVSGAPDSSAAELALWMPGGRATKVRGTTAIYLQADEAYLIWLERPGTTVSLQARDISERELLKIAEELREMPDEEWQKLVDGLRPPGTVVGVPDVGPPPGVTPTPTAWFVVVPVVDRADPPCGSIRNLWFVETRAGREVACYRVSGPAFDATAVASAAARPDQTTGTWTVEFTLTDAGAGRFDGLFRGVGAGGQYAVVVDGRLVSAPRLDAAPAGKGLITGLDESTARGIADRLPR